jgi:hypothetical protein
MFNSAYEQSLSLQRKTTKGMSTLYEDVSSWVGSADGLPDALPGGFSLKRLDDLSYACAKGRDSVRAALVAGTNNPDERYLYRSGVMAQPRSRFSVAARWMSQWTGSERFS